jgi:hypothetical protein
MGAGGGAPTWRARSFSARGGLAMKSSSGPSLALQRGQRTSWLSSTQAAGENSSPHGLHFHDGGAGGSGASLGGFFSLRIGRGLEGVITHSLNGRARQI